MTQTVKSRWMLISAMVIFSTIGILRKYIPLPSSAVALVRAIVGTIFLLAVILIKKKPIDFRTVRKNAVPMLLSGAALGFNWIFLFESYCYTSVAIATLCYYLAPILVILVSPLLFREKMTFRKSICAAVALVGMILVSGILETGGMENGEFKGMLYGLAAAALYATVILLNKKMTSIESFDKTIVQLAVSSIILLPYVLLTENFGGMEFSPISILLLAVAGIFHTGVAYLLYFGAIPHLPASTAALYSYMDPILAIVLSMIFLKEPMSIYAGIGAVLILGSAYMSER